MITHWCSITFQNKILNHTAVNISKLNVTYPYWESYMRDTNVSQENRGGGANTCRDCHIVNISCSALEYCHIFLGPMIPVFNSYKLQNGYTSSHFILRRQIFLQHIMPKNSILAIKYVNFNCSGTQTIQTPYFLSALRDWEHTVLTS